MVTINQTHYDHYAFLILQCCKVAQEYTQNTRRENIRLHGKSEKYKAIGRHQTPLSCLSISPQWRPSISSVYILQTKTLKSLYLHFNVYNCYRDVPKIGNSILIGRNVESEMEFPWAYRSSVYLHGKLLKITEADALISSSH